MKDEWSTLLVQAEIRLFRDNKVNAMATEALGLYSLRRRRLISMGIPITMYKPETVVRLS